MEAPDQKADAASRVIALLRRATRIVQIAPFVYLALYVIYMFGTVFIPDNVLNLADCVMFSSPMVTGGLLTLSKLFKLCKWHKIACLFPSTSQVEGFVDNFVVTFTQNEIILINSLIGLAAILFALAAYRHFFANGR